MIYYKVVFNICITFKKMIFRKLRICSLLEFFFPFSVIDTKYKDKDMNVRVVTSNVINMYTFDVLKTKL